MTHSSKPCSNVSMIFLWKPAPGEVRNEMKLNESGFRSPLCTYRLNWTRRTSWEWWDDWDDTVLQTQDSKFEPWWSETEHATSRSRRLSTILTFTRGWRRNNFVSFKPPPRPGTEPRTLAWKAAVLTTTLGPPPGRVWTPQSRQRQLQSTPLYPLRHVPLWELIFDLHFSISDNYRGGKDEQMFWSGLTDHRYATL